MISKPRLSIIAGLYNTNSVEVGDGWTARRTGAGTYYMYFRPGFRVVSFTASSKGGIRVVSQIAIAGNVVTFGSNITTTGAVDDQGLFFVAAGWETVL